MGRSCAENTVHTPRDGCVGFTPMGTSKASQLEPRCNRQPPSFFAPSPARHARSNNQNIIAQDHCGCWFRPSGDEAMDSRGAGQFHNAASPAHAVKAKIHSRIVAPKPSFWREPELLRHRPWWARPGMAGGGQGGRWLDRKQAPRLPVGTGYAPTVRGCSGRRHCPLLRLQARIPCHSVPFRAIPCHSAALGSGRPAAGPRGLPALAGRQRWCSGRPGARPALPGEPHRRPWWAHPGMAGMAGGGQQGGRWLDRKQAPRLPAGTGYAPTVRGCSGRRHCSLLRLQACVLPFSTFFHLFPPGCQLLLAAAGC
jgi:hypothetical protein